MNCDLNGIPKVCRSISGVAQAILITDPSNITTTPGGVSGEINFIDTDKVYAITHSKNLGRYSESKKTGDGGDYYDQSLSFFVPRRRVEVETLIKRLHNRRVVALYVDRNLFQGVLWNARVFFNYDSGAAFRDRNGYAFEIVATSLRELAVIAGNAELPVGDPGEGEGGGGGGQPSSCCVYIEPTQLAYNPTPTGNSEHFSEFVTGANGGIYYIDPDGRSILLGRPAPHVERFEGVSGSALAVTVHPLPDPAMGADFVAAHIMVKRDSRWLHYNLTDAFTIDKPNEEIEFDEPLDNENVEVYIWPF